MQEQGARCLNGVTEDAVLSFFVSEDGLLQKGCSYKKNISTVFKAGLKWKGPQCRRILGFLPLLRETRKIYNTLHRMKSGPEEGSRGQGILCPQQSSYPPAPFTGPRGYSIAGLTFGSIDWEKGRILADQQKTSVPVGIPLSVVAVIFILHSSQCLFFFFHSDIQVGHRGLELFMAGQK